jgi:hypothetical protein
MSKNSFNAKKNLDVAGKSFEIFDISSIDGAKDLPFSLKVLLENLLRTEDGANITADHIKALAHWDPSVEPDTEIQFTPARVVMQDFTGVPCIVDLATMREAIVELGGDASKVNPLAPAELVIDHSVIADVFGTKNSFEENTDIEYERNQERYRFLRWGQSAFDEFKVVPPGTGIVHQVNIEFLARVIMTRTVGGVLRAYPDTVVGTDSHTTMVNGLGVLGWGVGGIEAEAALLGQPVSMLIPRVVGFKLSGTLPLGTTATEIADAKRNENIARAIVDSFTGRGFTFERKILEVVGQGTDYIPVWDTIYKVNQVFENGKLVYDITNTTTGPALDGFHYEVTKDRTSIVKVPTDSSYYESKDRSERKPLKYRDAGSDSFYVYAPYENYDNMWTNTKNTAVAFPEGFDYIIDYDSGYKVIPHDVQDAVEMIINDLKCGRMDHYKSYVTEYETDQFKLKYDSSKFFGTGNILVDIILDKYITNLRTPGML